MLQPSLAVKNDSALGNRPGGLAISLRLFVRVVHRDATLANTFSVGILLHILHDSNEQRDVEGAKSRHFTVLVYRAVFQKGMHYEDEYDQIRSQAPRNQPY